MTKRKKDNSVGPWAKEKLEALGQYLNFYTTVLKNQGHWLRGTSFVDAFAGPGLSKIREKDRKEAPPGLFPDADSEEAEVEYLKGSPRVALEIANPFTSYTFIDSDKKRIAELEALKQEYGNTRNIVVTKGDANRRPQDLARERNRLEASSRRGLP